MAKLTTEVGNNGNDTLVIEVIETDRSDSRGACIYRWYVMLYGPSREDMSWSECDIKGPPAGGETEEGMLTSFLSFLGACFEGRAYSVRTGRTSDNEDMFDADMMNELDLVGFGEEECSMLHIERTERAGHDGVNVTFEEEPDDEPVRECHHLDHYDATHSYDPDEY